MKSVVVTFLMFVVVFILLKFDALALIDNSIFRIGSFVLFCCVLGCAIYFVGIPDFKQLQNDIAEDRDNLEQSVEKTSSNKAEKKSKKESKKA